MKKIKYTILLIICILSISTVSKALPEAEFTKLLKEYTYKPDGSLELHYSKILKINSHIAFNNLYGETFVVYNPAFQELKINESYTKQAGGNIVKTPQNAFNKVLPRAASGAPYYNHLKEMVITHTGLEIGATIYLDYTLFSKPVSYNCIDIDEILQEACPIKEYTVILNIPADQELNYTLCNLSAKPKITTQNGIKQYRWTFKNIPAASQEAFQPVNRENKPRFIAYGNKSCKEALEILKSKIQPVLSPENTAFAKKLAEKAENEREKVFCIQNYMVNQVNTIDLSLENTAYTLRTPDEVLQTSYGTKAEKTALFAALLKANGLTPEPVAVYPGNLKNKSKGINTIQELKIKVNADKHPLFLSAMYQPAESLELRGGKDEIWLLSDSGIRPLTVIQSEGQIRCQADIILKPTETTAKGIIDIQGGLLSMASKNSLEKRIKAFSEPFGQTTESQISSESAVNYRLSFKANSPLVSQDGYIVYNLPETEQGIKSWEMSRLNTDRKSTLEIPYLITETYDYLLSIEPGIEFKSNPVEIKKQNKIGSVNIRIRQINNTIQVHKEIQLSKNTITPAEYGDFRALLTEWQNPLGQKLIFKKNDINK